MIQGPDPARLTDEQLLDAATRLAALGQRIAGQPGVPVSGDRIREMESEDPASWWLVVALRALFAVLAAEDGRRTDEDSARMVAELEAWLEGGPHGV